MKKTILAITAIAVLFSLNIVMAKTSKDLSCNGSIDKLIAEEVEAINLAQEAYREINGKYLQIFYYEKCNAGYKVREYLAPPYDESGVGYVIYIYKFDGTIISTGYGPHAESNTWTHTPPKINPSEATSTIEYLVDRGAGNSNKLPYGIQHSPGIKKKLTD